MSARLCVHPPLCMHPVCLSLCCACICPSSRPAYSFSFCIFPASLLRLLFAHFFLTRTLLSLTHTHTCPCDPHLSTSVGTTYIICIKAMTTNCQVQHQQQPIC